MMSLTLEEIFNSKSIRKRAEESWNEKSIKSKQISRRKYVHIFEKYYPKHASDSWNIDFEGLSKPQKNILLKGELIRTYDSLPNHDKTKIKEAYKLSTFSSKWFKLPSQDKRKLLSYVLI